MRIESDYSSWNSARLKIAKPGQEGFEEIFQKNKKEEENKGRLVTVREGGYLRQYIVQSNGSKILLSETKQYKDEAAADSSHLLAPLPQTGGMSLNTKEALHLLNLQAGAAGIIGGAVFETSRENGKKS
ncbi:hypothetical protein AWU65_15740 [Paenibacillus glucanolyticus]|uniref:Uncharacterized protein n=1 Tax=Paenibacillus glucanolyticus TaxID=59843 RepID=A0A163KJE1_9BACL|nr:hypothetical protein [Paenibacillus glucanolyticus]KZS47276.1 hypothetical protein AWU65_15740 [Paenibacillus glucanolyticus]